MVDSSEAQYPESSSSLLAKQSRHLQPKRQGREIKDLSRVQVDASLEIQMVLCSGVCPDASHEMSGGNESSDMVMAEDCSNRWAASCSNWYVESGESGDSSSIL
jgi:hypothetical protein